MGRSVSVECNLSTRENVSFLKSKVSVTKYNSETNCNTLINPIMSHYLNPFAKPFEPVKCPSFSSISLANLLDNVYNVSESPSIINHVPCNLDDTSSKAKAVCKNGKDESICKEA